MIKVEALSRNYGDFTAVDQVSFTIESGEIVGLLGHNGAGKTTIMKMLTGYLEPTSGYLEVDGHDIVRKRSAAQSIIGYLPENCPLYLEMTAVDYLDYAATLRGVPTAQRDARIRDAVAQTDLGDKVIETIATLSRGYRQRVGVAQAILHQPKILILDEPTNGLDPTQIQHMRDLIRAQAKRSTVILSTHILQEVQAVCDRVIILRGGQLALDARMAELRTGNRLLVSLDAAPEKAKPVLGGLSSVTSVECLPQNGSHQYALALDGTAAIEQLAPQVAQTVVSQGFKLFALQEEGRDLETIFGEISTR